MVTTFNDLGKKERCIYDAFSKATKQTGSHLAGEVNAKGVGADDTEAVRILAKKYGFVQTPKGCYGDRFNALLKDLEEPTEFIVLVCTGMGPSMVAAKSAQDAGFQYDFANGFDASRMFSDQVFDDILWHAIYVKGNPGGTKVVHDVQGLRPTGPVSRDRIIWLAR